MVTPDDDGDDDDDHHGDDDDDYSGWSETIGSEVG